MSNAKFMRLTLLGTSGVGKSTLSAMLSREGWYYYSGDLRIAKHYLAPTLSAWLNDCAKLSPVLSALLAEKAISIAAQNGVKAQMALLSAYINKLGQGGLDWHTFIARQRAFAEAEKAAMYEVEAQIAQAERLDKPYFVNDAGGSVGEYAEDEALFAYLSKHTLLVYIHADSELNAEILKRAVRYPKPICYDERFLREQVVAYASEQMGRIGESEVDAGVANTFDADAFLRFVAPKMLAHRQRRFSNLAARYGVSVEARAVWQCRSAMEFLALVKAAYAEQRGSVL